MEIRILLRSLLILSDMIMVVMACIILSRRQLPPFDLIAWLLLSILLPFLGPFLTISIQSRQIQSKE